MTLMTMKPINKVSDSTLLIAVDPSLNGTGIAVMREKEGPISLAVLKQKPPKKGEEDIRFIEIAKRIKSLLDTYSPDVMAIETQYIAFRTKSLLKLVEVKGLIVGLYINYCLDNDIEPVIIDVNPMEAKSAVGVPGRLKRVESKQRVRDAVVGIYPILKDDNQDIIDAVSIGIAGMAKYRLRKMFKK